MNQHTREERDRLRRKWAAGEASPDEIDRCHQLDLAAATTARTVVPDGVYGGLFFHHRRPHLGDRRPVGAAGLPRCERFGCGRLFTPTGRDQRYCETCAALPLCPDCRRPHDPGDAPATLAGRCARCSEDPAANASGRSLGGPAPRRSTLTLVPPREPTHRPLGTLRDVLRRLTAAWLASGLPVPARLRPSASTAMVGHAHPSSTHRRQRRNP